MTQKISICTNKYKFGSFNRSHFKKYTTYNFFDYIDFNIMNKSDEFFWNDDLMKELLDTNKISETAYNEYISEIDTLVAENLSIWELSNEEMYKTFNDKRNHILNKYNCSCKLEPKYKSYKLIDGINQSNQKDILLKSMDNILLVFGTTSDFLSAKEDIELYVSLKKHLYIIVKKDNFLPSFSICDFNKYNYLKEIYNITCIFESYPSRGFDFSNLEFNRELELALQNNNIWLCGYGEDVLLSVKDLLIPSIVHTNTDTMYGQALTNLFSKYTYSVIYIPKEYNILDFIPIIEVPKLTYMHLSFLSDRFGDYIYKYSYDQLIAIYPKAFVNIYSEKPEVDYSLFQNIDINNKINLANSLYNSDKLKAYTHIHSFEGSVDKTLVNILTVNESKNSEVLIIDSYNDLSFRRYMDKESLLDQPKYICNFMFFTTKYVIDLYNRIRKKRTKEQIPYNCSHIDYFMIKTHNNIRQSFPLYNKSCIGMNDEGKFVFFSFLLRGGVVHLNDHKFIWHEDDVNPINANNIAIYTPYVTKNDDDLDTINYVKEIGQNRINIIIIGDKITCIRDGSVYMPSLGVVVSLDRDIFINHPIFNMSLRDNNGYYNFDNILLKIELQHPKSLTEENFKNLKWVFGGGLSLIKNGIGIYDKGINSKNEFIIEGWQSPLSMQTQESKIQDEDAIHPRTLLGLTKEQKFFVLVISGRSKDFRGVNYKEAIEIARNYIGQIDFMMNVDGGASSVLGFATNGTFMELSYPACSVNTTTGLIRNINSIMIIG